MCPENRGKIVFPRGCQLCGKDNHLATNCDIFQVTLRTNLNGPNCEKCGENKHTADNCRPVECRYCKNEGHTIKECIKREYAEKKKAITALHTLKCNHCNRLGHSSEICRFKQQVNTTLTYKPTYPI